MPLPETEPLTASDDEIVAALAEAELPPSSGPGSPDRRPHAADTSLRVDPLLINEPQGGLTPDQQARSDRSRLRCWASGATASCPPPATVRQLLLELMEFAVGGGPWRTTCRSSRKSWA